MPVMAAYMATCVPDVEHMGFNLIKTCRWLPLSKETPAFLVQRGILLLQQRTFKSASMLMCMKARERALMVITSSGTSRSQAFKEPSEVTHIQQS